MKHFKKNHKKRYMHTMVFTFIHALRSSALIAKTIRSNIQAIKNVIDTLKSSIKIKFIH